MILCLDVGNSQIYGGVFVDDKLKLRFRRNSRTGASSDEIGIFLRSVLRENDIDPRQVKQIALCTVVPEVLHSLRNACMKYFNITPFNLQAGLCGDICNLASNLEVAIGWSACKESISTSRCRRFNLFDPIDSKLTVRSDGETVADG